MRRLAWMLFAVILLTAGCLGLGDDDAEETPDAGEEADPASTNATDQTQASTDGEEEEASDEKPERTLEDPPALEDGEWWTVEITSSFTGLETQATVVKAGGHGERYMVGMPDAQFVENAVLLHMPPHGPVEASTLGYPVHESIFHPLTFPLEEGQSWQTTWIGETLEAEVTNVDAEEGVAHIEMEGENGLSIEIHHEADLGYPRYIEIDGYGSYEIVDHGYDYDGDVHVPWNPEIAFFSGRIAGAIDTNLQPAPPMEEIEVTGDHDEAVVALLLGNVAEAAPGHYEASATGPDGSTHEASLTATPGGDSWEIAATVHEDPTGTWEMEYIAGGAGVAAAEAIAYEAMHVVLEDGEMQGTMDMG